MPGMKVTVSTAMRVRDVSRPSPQQEDDARAKVAEWPGLAGPADAGPAVGAWPQGRRRHAPAMAPGCGSR